MEILFWIITSIGAVLSISYFVLIARYCHGWTRTERAGISGQLSTRLTVIIAVRNEEAEIVNCLEALLAQDYPRSLTEILFVDDHSTDSTARLIENFTMTCDPMRYLKLPEGREGKKEAIAFAIQQSTGSLIVITDGDCVMGESWLSSIASFHENKKPEMIVGPVAFHGERSIFQKMQSLEFMALITCGGASLFHKKAIMCNGANLAFTRKAFDEVNGYENISAGASGDDVLLMYKVNKLHPGKVMFLKSEKAIVFTKAKETLSGFIQQRKRWASKGFSALNAETRRVSLLVWLFSAWLVFAPVVACLCFTNTAFHPIFLEICLILAGIKCFIDFLLLFLSASFFNKKGLLLFFIPEQIIYVIYVVVFGLIGSLGKYEWKGRKTK